MPSLRLIVISTARNTFTALTASDGSFGYNDFVDFVFKSECSIWLPKQ